jgi:hypothetical protein
MEDGVAEQLLHTPADRRVAAKRSVDVVLGQLSGAPRLATLPARRVRLLNHRAEKCSVMREDAAHLADLSTWDGTCEQQKAVLFPRL